MICGSIGYACASGLGHLNKWFYEHKVVDRVFVVEHPEYASHMEWFPGAPSTPLRHPNINEVMGWLNRERVDVLLCYETPFFWPILGHLRDAGRKSVLIPMHEWHPARPQFTFDAYLCPSALDFDVFNAMFQDSPPKVVTVTVPVDPSTWRRRTKVRRFLHNAGHVGHREHKGTRQLLEAMRHVTKPINLTVTTQLPVAKFMSMVSDDVYADKRIKFVFRGGGEDRYDTLFSEEFDAYVAPEKFNGLSLPLQEARAAGMLVVTTDRYPANTWLPKYVPVPSPDSCEVDGVSALIPVASYQRAKVCTSCVEVDEAIVRPEDIAQVLDAWHGVDVSGYSESGLEWAQANSWEVWAPRYRKLLEELL